MRLTLHTDYALRVLMHLALVRDRLVSVGEIAEAFDISRAHLVKVAANLVRAGYVDSMRGRGGGLLLARSPAEIRIGEVVKALEPDLAPVACLGCEPARDESCVIERACDLKDVFALARDAFLDQLDRFTLADVVSRPAKMRSLLGLGVAR